MAQMISSAGIASIKGRFSPKEPLVCTARIFFAIGSRRKRGWSAGSGQ
jgi:hypothetical protein